MATTKKTTPKKSVSEDTIISAFMESVLKNNKEPINCYTFCVDHQIEESTFYSFFGSIDAVKETIWVKFMENTVAAMQKEPSYEDFSAKDKLLTFYFTFFEVLTLNRSYVVFYLKEAKDALKNLAQLRKFRNAFKTFVDEIQETAPNFGSGRFSQVKQSAYSEGAWIQLLFLLRFWIDDDSRGFEKTDILIEKSVTTTVDLLDTKHLENLFDLGKFLWNERKR